MTDFSVAGFSLSLFLKSVVFWAVFCVFFKWLALVLGRRYFSSVDIYKCYLPDEFPVEKQRGIIKDWTRSVMTVGEDVLDSFLKFRNIEIAALSKTRKQELAANEALKYRNELFEENLLFYYEEKFLHKRRSPFPIMMKTWNAEGFFGEMGSACQLFWAGMFTFGVHHFFGGLLSLYALQVDISYARWIVYCDIGFNAVELVLMLVSMLTRMDYTLYSGPRRMDRSKGDYTMAGHYRMMTFHHIAASTMETLALVGKTDPVLIAEGGLAMMGTTGVLYVISTLTDAMPIRENKRARFLFTAFVALVYIWERGVIWITKLVPGLLLDTYAKSGLPATVIAAVGLTMFTQVNCEFLRMYSSKTRKLYGAYIDGEKAKRLL